MQATFPDYFIALVKQRAGLLNDEQARRSIMAMSKTLESSLTPAQANRFFGLAPSYLRPAKQSFFTAIGNWQKPLSANAPIDQLAARLQLTSSEEAEVLFEAYFAAIRTVIGREAALKLGRSLPTDIARLYTHSQAA